MAKNLQAIEEVFTQLASEREGATFYSFSMAFDYLVVYGTGTGAIGRVDGVGAISLISQGNRLSSTWYIFQLTQPNGESQSFAVWGHEAWESYHWEVMDTQVVNGTVYPELLVTIVQHGIEQGTLNRDMKFLVEKIKDLKEELDTKASIARALSPGINLDILDKLEEL